MALYDEISFGIEIELTFGTRRQAISVISNYFGVSYEHTGGHYDRYECVDNLNRRWVVLSDSSITPLKVSSSGRAVAASSEYQCEIVSPILYAKDIENLQQLIRELRKAGFKPSTTCGIHVHTGLKGLGDKTLVHILNNIHSKQKLLFEALGVDTSSSRYRYCKAIPTELVENLKKKKAKTISQIADVWYSTLSNGNERYSRYPQSRYYIVNLTRGLIPDSPYYYGTVEFRCFPSTVHAGKIKAYIQFCLLLVAHCAELSRSSYKITEIRADESRAYKLRVFLLHLNAIGKNYATLRHHWLENFNNQSKAWRRGERIVS